MCRAASSTCGSAARTWPTASPLSCSRAWCRSSPSACRGWACCRWGWSGRFCHRRHYYKAWLHRLRLVCCWAKSSRPRPFAGGRGRLLMVVSCPRFSFYPCCIVPLYYCGGSQPGPGRWRLAVLKAPLRRLAGPASPSAGPRRGSGRPWPRPPSSGPWGTSMKSHTEYLTFNIPSKMAFVNITPQVAEAVRKSGVMEGLVLCNSLHITSSVFINDDEAGLHHDFGVWLEKLAPFNPDPNVYHHNRTGEDNADAHLKRQIMGREVVVAITKGKLDFGPWEQIFYGEFDGNRPKRVLVKVIGE